jgi:hypothetical protein
VLRLEKVGYSYACITLAIIVISRGFSKTRPPNNKQAALSEGGLPLQDPRVRGRAATLLLEAGSAYPKVLKQTASPLLIPL